jgi:hypothetical protein
MRKRITIGVLVLSVASLSAAAIADDLKGADVILCTAVQAMVCSEDGDCVVDNPWAFNIPQFLEFDLKGKKVSTTKASGEERSSPLRTVERDAEAIYLQGLENGRAFSLVINESSGMLSAAVARDGKSVGVFGACTPMPSSTK